MTVAWLVTVCSAVPVLTVAWMVTVTEPPAGTTPSQVTVLVPTLAVAVPAVAEALTRVSCEGRTSVSSGPVLFCWSKAPLFVRTTV